MAGDVLVRVERQGARGELVLNRPQRRNALIRPLVEELHAGLDELVADEAVNAILIRGEGGTLCAGLDLKARKEEPELLANFGPTWASYHAAVYDCPKPIIGALEGAAIAGGSGLALSCDFLIATEGEMKKVNWSTRREIWGSTKVVIVFTLFLAFLLFSVDIVFWSFFSAIDVLKGPSPFGSLFGGS